MRYFFSFLATGWILFSISGCDVLNSEGKGPKPIFINSSITNSIQAADVIKNKSGIFILGEAKEKDGEGDDFYVAKIDQNGNVLWEKMYGSNLDEEANAIISTSDSHLLVVGLTEKSPAVHSSMYVIKMDYSGNIVWENKYSIAPDKAIFSGNDARTVIEVSNGYIIGGQGMMFWKGSGHGVPVLTKIGFNGEKKWSKALSGEYGFVNGIAKLETGSRFAIVGDLPGASIPILKASNADTARIINLEDFYFGNLTFMGLVNINGNLIAPTFGGKRMVLFGVNSDGSGLRYYYHRLFPEIYSININRLTNSNDVVTTGYVVDETGDHDIFAVRNATSIANVWHFKYDISGSNEVAIGAFALPDSSVGIIANQYHNNTILMMLLKLDAEGNLE